MATRRRKTSEKVQSAHLVTIGTSPSPSTNPDGDVVTALIKDIGPLAPTSVTALCTADSQDNAKRFFAGLRMSASQINLVILESAQSLDEAYRRTSDEIERLVDAGYERSSILLHYTAGTKVMSAGAVLAAVGAGVHALRYLAASPRDARDAKPTSVESMPRSVIAHRELRHATELFFELRFSKSAYVATQLDPSLMSNEGKASREILRAIAPAYYCWDNFRAADFLRHYREGISLVPTKGRLRVLRVSPQTVKAIEVIANAEAGEGLFPQELIFDLWNNALRRMMERRYDDALIRFYRAAELYAQHLLLKEYGLRADNLDIRRVPPRSRAGFEAERRLDDATIKLGLRNSYTLLEVLGHQVGAAFRADKRFQDALDERRTLVLAHGVSPCPLSTALTMARELGSFLELTIPKFAQRASEIQFPWIRNSEVLRLLEREEKNSAPEEAGEELLAETSPRRR